jgi:hypothetical protein
MGTEIEIRNPNMPAHADTLTVDDMRGQVQLIQRIMQGVMQEGEHYGVIPGTKGKPTLLKAGAEKLSMTFRLVPEYRIERTDYEGGHREYVVTCRLTHAPTGTFQGEGVGSCSTMEKKYRYRNEWTNGKKTQIENPDIADNYNTVLKMAKKRAHVDAILTSVAASDFFTQDLEDMPREEQPTPKQQARKPSGDGHSAPATPAPSSAPAQTWGQKIDAAKAQLDRYAEASEQTWSDARRFVLERTETWPEPHRLEVLEHIKRISGDRGEIPEPENVEPIEFR